MVKSSCTRVTRQSISVVRVDVVPVRERMGIKAFKKEVAWAIANKQLWLVIITMLSSKRDLQPSTVTANQIPGHLVSTEN